MLQLILILICGILSVIVIERLKKENKRLNDAFIEVHEENERLLNINKEALSLSVSLGSMLQHCGNWDYNSSKHVITLTKRQILTLEEKLEALMKVVDFE
jgi:hypothetical protein